MKSSMKKFFALFVCICMLASGTVYAQEGSDETGSVKINATNFPDKNFRDYVKGFDTDENGTLSAEEIAAVKVVDVYFENGTGVEISDLTGIEYFTSLTELYCWGNDLKTKTLDLSKNTKLTVVWCFNNGLINLDVSNNVELTELWCYGNQLTKLDVSKSVKLTELFCSNNQLTELDVSENKELTELYCDDNQLTSLDVSKNAKLEYLSCADNQLTTLDVSKNMELKSLDVRPLVKANVRYTKEPDEFYFINTDIKNPEEVKAGTCEIDLGEIKKSLEIEKTEDIDVTVKQGAPNSKNQEFVTNHVEKSGGKILNIYDVIMYLQRDGQDNAMITANFGKLTLSFYAGKEHAGKKAVVYQLHGTNEIIPHKNLTVNSDGMVTIEVTKLSTFAVALQGSTAQNPAGSTTTTNTNTPANTDGSTNANNAGSNDSNAANTAPSTGDSANMTVWIAMIMLTMSAILIVILGRRQKR